MLQIHSVTWDGNSADPVTLTASFTMDAETGDAPTAASIAAAFNARKTSAAITIATPDPATVTVTLTL